MGYWLGRYWPIGPFTASTIEEAIEAILAADATLAGLVLTRIYPLFLPQKCALPAVCYRKISETVQHAMIIDATVKEARVQISSFAKTYDTVKDVVARVKTVLSRYSGTVETIVIQDIFLEPDLGDIYEPDTEVYHVPLDFIVFYT